ncbi:ervatamin-B-like [Macadamia integrifolia]|uniref:ervatamin-B-like n=1 Tax=Macadamia integrifolia TaxID=60698 RepID=UPI001C4EBC9C|nr:ervatamin-B-like [Macadamia integrifolia]
MGNVIIFKVVSLPPIIHSIEMGKVAVFVFVALSVLALVLGLAQSFEFEARELETKDSLWELYERWTKHFKVSRDPSEKQMRLSLFKDKANYVHEFNNKKDRTSYELELNIFSDMTELEVKEFVTCYDSSYDKRDMHHHRHHHHHQRGLTIPSSIDWRAEGAVTSVKYQGRCGSCWAFSAVAAIEGLNKIKNQSLVVLSEQQIIDCNKASYACCGGWYSNSFQNIITYNGLTTETNYPYTCEYVSCDNGTNANLTCKPLEIVPPLVTITDYGWVDSNNESALKEAVAIQPISVAIDSSGADFQGYKEGIFVGPCGTETNHAVTIVGYGTDTVGTGYDYWIVKNSWGTTWGDQGYIYMRRGISAKEGLCGIAQYPAYPIK